MDRNKSGDSISKLYKLTGNAGNIIVDYSAEGITNAYNTIKGMLASTTGNIYGIYDMSGGAAEFTAAWNNKSTDSALTKNGRGYFVTNGTSDRTKTAYTNDWYTNCDQLCQNVCRIGDGIKETWVSDSRLWFYEHSIYPYDGGPFSIRNTSEMGEINENIFSSGAPTGMSASVSFRVVLIAEN